MSIPKSFWFNQLSGGWTNLQGMTTRDRIRQFSILAKRMMKYHLSAIASPEIGTEIQESEKLTVVLLNHKRPRNVASIARYILQAGFVGKLVISNNSQDYPIERYVRETDPRLVLINQDEPSGVGIRFELAREYASNYYMLIDDDIFLHPLQLQWLYFSLRYLSDRPHGILGAAMSADRSSDEEWPFEHRRGVQDEVDILNGLFMLTGQQLEEYFRLCSHLGITDQKSLMNGEDIILCFSGDRKPLIHDVGPIWECESASRPGVALYVSRPNFYEERWRIFSELSRIKRLGQS